VYDITFWKRELTEECAFMSHEIENLRVHMLVHCVKNRCIEHITWFYSELTAAIFVLNTPLHPSPVGLWRDVCASSSEKQLSV